MRTARNPNFTVHCLTPLHSRPISKGTIVHAWGESRVEQLFIIQTIPIFVLTILFVIFILFKLLKKGKRRSAIVRKEERKLLYICSSINATNGRHHVILIMDGVVFFLFFCFFVFCVFCFVFVKKVGLTTDDRHYNILHRNSTAYGWGVALIINKINVQCCTKYYNVINTNEP